MNNIHSSFTPRRMTSTWMDDDGAVELVQHADGRKVLRADAKPGRLVPLLTAALTLNGIRDE